MTLETLTDIFAAIGVAACLWWGAVLTGRLSRRVDRSGAPREEAEARRLPPDSPPATGEEAIPAEHVAAIAAAVAACGHRVVHIDPAGGSAWVSEGRLIHQTSHRTH